MKNIERRVVPGTCEIRKVGDKPHIVGYGAVFNKLSVNLGGFVEQVSPGAFTKTLQESDIRGLFNHDENFVLGRNASKTMTLGEDGTGLFYDIDPPDTGAARDVITVIDRGDVSGSSFSFTVIEQEWGLTEQGFPLRTLKVVRLYDTGPVTFPAYPDTDAGLRSIVSGAVASLAESRSMPLEDVVAIALRGELRSLIGDPAPGTHPTPDLSAYRKRLVVHQHAV